MSQTQPGMQAEPLELPFPAADAPQAENDEVTIRAREQEKNGDLFILRGDVEILYRTFVVRAQEITYNQATGEVVATGGLKFDGGPNGEHIEAERGRFNINTETGRFEKVRGSTGVRFQGREVTLTTADPFSFTGDVVEKTGPETYVVHNGTITSCQLPNPKWTFNAGKFEVRVGDTARIYNTTFRVKGVPIFYFPFAAYPVDNFRRKSGFLIPVVGASSRKGTILGESFYWAINRSMDATIGAEYYSSRGWAQMGEFRARPTETSNVQFNYFGVLDRGFGATQADQGGQDMKLNAEAELPYGFRGVAALNYLSSFVFRLAFTETFNQAVNSEVKSLAFLSRSRRGFGFNVVGSRYQNFQSTDRGDLITIVRAPSIEASAFEHRVLNTPLYWGGDAAAEFVSRREPNFVTGDFVGRVDLRPRLSMPIFLRGWSFRPEVALRNTYYTERRVNTAALGVGAPVGDPINRRAIEGEFEIRPPALSRIFEGDVAGYRFKHTVQPRVTYRFVNGVNNLQNIIRFDGRDILSDTNEVEYALVQRFYRKPAQSDGVGAQEWISWEVAQKYFIDDDFGNAIIPGRRQQLTTTALFTGIAFLTEPRRFSPVVSRLRVHTTENTDVHWQLDYDTKKGRINASHAYARYKFGEWFAGGSHAFLHAPGEVLFNNPTPSPERFNQIRLEAGYGNLAVRGFHTSSSVGYDANLGFLQYASFQSGYNWDCCGVTMEYRRFALGAVRNENQFRFAFTLANVGTFGNLKRRERMF